MTRLVTVLLTLAVPGEADAEDAASSTALDVVAVFGVEGHLPVPGSVVQHRRGRQPWRVESVTGHGAVLSNLAGELVRLPLSVLVPELRWGKNSDSREPRGSRRPSPCPLSTAGLWSRSLGAHRHVSS